MKKILVLFMFVVASLTISAQKFEVGDKVWAFEVKDNFWYEATILEKVDGIYYKIHWEGFDSKYDQPIHAAYMKKEGMPYVVGDWTQGMETDGKWYNIEIKKRDLENKKYFIHWGGFDAKYDRWLSHDSIRLMTKANNIDAGKFQKVESASSGSGTISVTVKNKCSGKAYFYMPPVSGMGTYKHEAVNGNGSKSVFVSNGEEIWLSNEKKDKIQLLFKGGSSSGSQVILCE